MNKLLISVGPVVEFVMGIVEVLVTSEIDVNSVVIFSLVIDSLDVLVASEMLKSILWIILSDSLCKNQNIDRRIFIIIDDYNTVKDEK